MNKARWTKPNIPLQVLALKLVEECGEVANELTDAYITGNGVQLDSLLEELEHVEFIARTMRNKIGLDR